MGHLINALTTVVRKDDEGIGNDTGFSPRLHSNTKGLSM